MNTQDSTSLIIIKNLSYRWDHRFCLSIPFWEMKTKERVAIVGASGYGKSTFLLLLSGMLAVDQGELWVLGAPLHLMNDQQRRMWRAQNIGFVTQNFALLEHLTVAENILLPQQLLSSTKVVKHSPTTHKDLSSALLKYLQIDQYSDNYPHELSQGEQQRVAISRAFSPRASLLLLDEANAHLDEEKAHSLSYLLTQICTSHQNSVDELNPSLKTIQDHLSIDGLIAVTHRTQTLSYFTQQLDISSWSYKHNVAAQVITTPVKNHKIKQKTSLHYKRLFHHAWAVLHFYKSRTLLLLFTLALTCALPLLLNQFVTQYQLYLQSRATNTPLVAGAPGSRYDLILDSLYWSQSQLSDLSWADTINMKKISQNTIVPLHLKWSVQGRRLVGTSNDYYSQRQLTIDQGHLPYRIGEVVVGQRVAKRFNIQLNQYIKSEQKDLYNLAATYPMELKVVGILHANYSSDDEAYFTDIKTSWLIEGLGHGHQAVDQSKGVVELNAAIVTAQQVNQENHTLFHFHGSINQFPVSSVLIFPKSDKDASLFKARSQRQNRWQVVQSSTVINEIMSFVLKLQGLLSALAYLLLTLTIILSTFILWLNAQMRKQEWHALKLLGFKKVDILSVFMSEVLSLIVTSSILVGLLYLLLGYVLNLYGSSWMSTIVSGW